MALIVKNLPANVRDIRDPGLRRSPRLLPGESYGQRSLVGYGPQDHKESDMTEAT